MQNPDPKRYVIRKKRNGEYRLVEKHWLRAAKRHKQAPPQEVLRLREERTRKYTRYSRYTRSKASPSDVNRILGVRVLKSKDQDATAKAERYIRDINFFGEDEDKE